MSQKKIAAITGASNGMGYEAAKLFASKGYVVYAGARRVEKIPTDAGIIAVKLDVTDSASNQAFIQQVLDEAGQIDVLVNNAGYGEFGPTEEIPLERAKKQFDTNYFGAVELTQLVLPSMRARHYGRIVNISSIAGNVYTPLGAHYYASKAALQQWSDTLDLEVAPFGIRSVVVQPGGTKSNWSQIAYDNAAQNLKENSPYAPLIKAMTALNQNISTRGASAYELAQHFYSAATDKNPKLRYFHSFSDRALVHLAKAHPRLYRNALRLMIRQITK